MGYVEKTQETINIIEDDVIKGLQTEAHSEKRVTNVLLLGIFKMIVIMARYYIVGR